MKGTTWNTGGDSPDCLTEKGRTATAHQKETTQRCAAVWGLTVGETPRDRTSVVDAIFLRDGVIAGVAEVRTRYDMDLRELRRRGSYLVTLSKLENGRRFAATLCVPFLLVVGLRPRGGPLETVVWFTIADAEGRWTVPRPARRTTTRAGVNGGTADRLNAYLPLTHMRILEAAAAPVERSRFEKVEPLDADDIKWGWP